MVDELDIDVMKNWEEKGEKKNMAKRIRQEGIYKGRYEAPSKECQLAHRTPVTIGTAGYLKNKVLIDLLQGVN